MSKLLLLLLFPLALLGCQADPAEKPSAQTVAVKSYLQGQEIRSFDIDCNARCQEALLKVDLRPVPPTKPCTRIYGGPEEIVLRGALPSGQAEARFNRQGGCEIARFESLGSFLESQGISYKDLFPDLRA